MKKVQGPLLYLTVVMLSSSQIIIGQETNATKLLKERNAEFRTEVIKVTEDVYTAVGYSVQPVSMLIGDDGIVIVDTGMDTESAEQVLADFRKITDKPVKAIIFTHGHGDHTGGASVFVGDGTPQIWARENYGAESQAFKSAGLTINNVRGARQGGFKLPPEKRINNGIAKAYWPERGGSVFHTAAGAKPTRTFSGTRKEIEIAGLRLHLVAATGETYDQLYVWLPDKRVLFSGDNFYKSWPNLYTIRGAPYRDVRAWADCVDKMLKEEPDFLVPGHTRPIIGREKIAEMLTNYRDAIRFVFDQTIEGMNKGLTPDELVDYVKLPERFAEKDYLRSYYGNPAWAVRSIFNAYLGWFDGNPTNLFPLSPSKEAKRVAELAGGENALLQRARQAVASGDYQWAAQLTDYLIALNPEASEPKKIKAQALEALAERLLTATGRNYYLTVAQELRSEADTREGMPRMGTVKLLRKGDVTIHTYMAAEESSLVTSHVIETENKLVVVDVQFMRPYAQELKSYIEQLGKAIERIIITHAHPDHWFGLEYFQDVPVFATQETADWIAKRGDFYIRIRRQQYGERITESKIVPVHRITEGREVIDGLTYEFENITDAEHEDQLIIKLSELRTIIVQDIVSNRAHAFVAGGRLNDWIKALEYLQTLQDYDVVLAGHGAPADRSVYGEMAQYLQHAKSVLATSDNAGQIERGLIDKYPDYGARPLARLSGRFTMFRRRREDNR